jgi:hypothetical protein
VQEVAVTVEHRIYCSQNGSVVSALTFNNTSDEDIYINKGFVAWEGQLQAASYEIWDGSKFAGFIGIHYEEVNGNETTKLLAKSKLMTLVDLNKYYEIERDVEYEMSFNEPAALINIGGVEMLNPLKSNIVKFTVDCI